MTMHHDGVCMDVLVVVVNPPWEAMAGVSPWESPRTKNTRGISFCPFFCCVIVQVDKMLAFHSPSLWRTHFLLVEVLFFFIFHPVLCGCFGAWSRFEETWGASHQWATLYISAIANETEYWSRQASWDELDKSDMKERLVSPTPNFKNTFCT